MDSVRNDAGRATVLVVDDEPEIAELYSDQLREDYSVMTAYSGMEAMDMIDSSVDVVLLDRRMPILSGDEVLERIRTQELDCRVVMVTAIEPDLDIVELDFDDYLVKPVSEAILLDAVNRMLERNTYDEHLQEALSLASKMATLESKMDISELEASREYERLEERFFELWETIELDFPADDVYAEGTIEKIRALIDTRTASSRDSNFSDE